MQCFSLKHTPDNQETIHATESEVRPTDAERADGFVLELAELDVLVLVIFVNYLAIKFCVHITK